MRSRARTVGAPFSTETATIAAQPECARKPTVACFTLRSGPVYLRAGTAARRWNLRGKTFCSLRRHAFHNLFYDFPGPCFLLRGGQHGLPAMFGLAADANLVFAERCHKHVAGCSVFAGPDFDSAAFRFPLGVIAGFRRTWDVFFFGRRERFEKLLNDS